MVPAEQNTVPGGASSRASPESIETAKRTKQLPFLNIKKIPGLLHPRPRVAAVVTLKTWASPALAVSIAGFVFCKYWWYVSSQDLYSLTLTAIRVFAVLRVQSIAYENFKDVIQGLFVLGLIIGATCAELLCSGRLNDAAVRRLARVYGGNRHPEMRLWLGYPAAIFSSIGLAIWGISIDEEWNWTTGECGLFLCTSSSL